MKNMKLVIVNWMDSSSRTGWWNIGAIKKDKVLLCRSVGWIVKENKEHIVLAPHITDWRKHKNLKIQGSGIISIPMKAIKKIETLKTWI